MKALFYNHFTSIIKDTIDAETKIRIKKTQIKYINLKENKTN